MGSDGVRTSQRPAEGVRAPEMHFVRDDGEGGDEGGEWYTYKNQHNASKLTLVGVVVLVCNFGIVFNTE